jgi:hypothetical protein
MSEPRRPPTATQQAYIPESFAAQATIRRDYCGGTPAVETDDSEDGPRFIDTLVTTTRQVAPGFVVAGVAAWLLTGAISGEIVVNGDPQVFRGPTIVGGILTIMAIAVVITAYIAHSAGVSR